MITPDVLDFPNNVISLITTRIPTYVDPDITVLLRPLHPTDPSQSVGVFPSTKAPDQESIEIASVEPTLKRYNLIVQAFVVDTNEEDCISVHSILSQRLWRMLYRDSPLRMGLTVLNVTADNMTERFQRHGITVQRYLSNEIKGSYLQTSWLEYWFETETVGMN